MKQLLVSFEIGPDQVGNIIVTGDAIGKLFNYSYFWQNISGFYLLKIGRL